MNLIYQNLQTLGRSTWPVLFFLLSGWTSFTATAQNEPPDSAQIRVAEYIRTQILDGDFGNRTLWMTAQPLDPSYIARDLIVEGAEPISFPYESTWLVMIDDFPGANFGHQVRWIFVNADLSEHSEPIRKSFPPIVLADGGQGAPVEFRCYDLTSVDCTSTGVFIPDNLPLTPIREAGCRYAVLVSGGINSFSNYDRYRQNLRSMYQILRACGYAKSNIFVYYADGGSLDLDNADSDNNDSTGSDVTAAAVEATIRAKIQNLCATLDDNQDVLFTYFSNHGADDTGVCLWDGNSNGLESSELYAPAELASDLANCHVIRQFMIHDQCFAGDFLPMATDGNHNNLAVYAAADATEYSYGREYMAQWEQNDPNTNTMNNMHQDVVNNGNLTSNPGKAEGTAYIGNKKACECGGGFVIPWKWLILIAVILVFPFLWWRMRR